jgi:hypothetical protein
VPGSTTTDTGHLDWLAPGQPVAPREALQRIERICAMQPTLFGALMCASVTHPGVPHEHIARALLQFRPDTEGLTLQDVLGLLTASHTGAREAFDAVMRSRRKHDRRSTLAAWVKPD